MVLSFAANGVVFSCCLLSLLGGVTFVIGARGERIWGARLPLLGLGGEVFDMMVVCWAQVRWMSFLCSTCCVVLSEIVGVFMTF